MFMEEGVCYQNLADIDDKTIPLQRLTFVEAEGGLLDQEKGV